MRKFELRPCQLKVGNPVFAFYEEEEAARGTSLAMIRELNQNSLLWLQSSSGHSHHRNLIELTRLYYSVMEISVSNNFIFLNLQKLDPVDVNVFFFGRINITCNI